MSFRAAEAARNLLFSGSLVKSLRLLEGAFHLRTIMDKINIAEKFSQIHEYWKPYIAAELNGQNSKYVIAEAANGDRIGIAGAELRTLGGAFAPKKTLHISVVYKPAAQRHWGQTTRKHIGLGTHSRK
jgi:hypothetical protein